MQRSSIQPFKWFHGTLQVVSMEMGERQVLSGHAPLDLMSMHRKHAGSMVALYPRASLHSWSTQTCKTGENPFLYVFHKSSSFLPQMAQLIQKPNKNSKDICGFCLEVQGRVCLHQIQKASTPKSPESFKGVFAQHIRISPYGSHY